MSPSISRKANKLLEGVQYKNSHARREKSGVQYGKDSGQYSISLK
jgi:hypothetical protein